MLSFDIIGGRGNKSHIQGCESAAEVCLLIKKKLDQKIKNKVSIFLRVESLTAICAEHFKARKQHYENKFTKLEWFGFN